MGGDRHGRAARVDNDPRRRPADGFRAAGARRFTAIVEEALAALPSRLHEAVADADLEVVDVPPPETTPWGRDGEAVPLASFTPGGGRGGRSRSSPRLVVFRRPLEARAATRAELTLVIRAAVGREVASALGIDDDLDDLWDDEP